MPRYSEAQKAECVRLRRAGVSERKVARELGMARTTVKRYWEEAQAGGRNLPAEGGANSALVQVATWPGPGGERIVQEPVRLTVEAAAEAPTAEQVEDGRRLAQAIEAMASRPLVVAESRRLPAPVKMPEPEPDARPGLAERLGALSQGVGELRAFGRAAALAVPVAGVGLGLWLWPKVAGRFRRAPKRPEPEPVPNAAHAPMIQAPPGESAEWGEARPIG